MLQSKSLQDGGQSCGRNGSQQDSVEEKGAELVHKQGGFHRLHVYSPKRALILFFNMSLE